MPRPPAGHDRRARELLSRARGLLFDFDAVVADSEPFFYESYNRAFRRRGHEIAREEYWE